MKRRARCYAGWCEKPVRKAGHMFCSQRCAAIWGIEIAHGNGLAWCAQCEEWKDPDECTQCEITAKKTEESCK